MENDNLTE